MLVLPGKSEHLFAEHLWAAASVLGRLKNKVNQEGTSLHWRKQQSLAESTQNYNASILCAYS